MGVCFSDISRNSISALRKKQPVVFRMARDLGYSPGDIKNMFKFFNFCDVDDSGTVSIEEMNAICRINNKRFGKLIFQLFDNENKGEITFEEFLVTAFGALSLDDSSLAVFAFRLFDLDNSGHLTSDEVENLVNVVCGSNAQSKAYIQMEMKKVDRKDDENYTSLNQFLDMTEKSKLMLLPAFEMRDMLRKNTLGIYRWRKLSRERKLKTGNKTIFEIISLLQTMPTSLQNCMNNPIKRIQSRRNSYAGTSRRNSCTGTIESIDRIKEERVEKNNDKIGAEIEDLGRRDSRTNQKILPTKNNEKEHSFFRGNSSRVGVTSAFDPRRKSDPSVPFKNASREENIDIMLSKRRKSGSSVHIDRNDDLSPLVSPQKRKKSIDMTGYVRDLKNINNDGIALTARSRRNSIDMNGSKNGRDTRSRSTSIDTDGGKSRRRSSHFNNDTNISVLKNLTESSHWATASRKNSINIDLSDLNKKSPAESRRNSKMVTSSRRNSIDIDHSDLNKKSPVASRRNSTASRKYSINIDLSDLNKKPPVNSRRNSQINIDLSTLNLNNKTSIQSNRSRNNSVLKSKSRNNSAVGK